MLGNEKGCNVFVLKTFPGVGHVVKVVEATQATCKEQTNYQTTCNVSLGGKRR